jgi:hypothetical protein
MLDAFIIEELKRRERLRQEKERPAAELPVPGGDDAPERKSDTQDEPEPSRGVVVIDLQV